MLNIAQRNQYNSNCHTWEIIKLNIQTDVMYSFVIHMKVARSEIILKDKYKIVVETEIL